MHLWEVPAEINSLVEGCVHVWCLQLRGSPAVARKFEAVLSHDELDRRDRFRFAGLRESFLLARGALRFLLSRYCGCRAQQIRFVYGPQGKPALAAQTRVRFNVSHSGDLALYAFALGCDLGVDIEQHRSMDDLEQIATRFFAPAEVQDLLSLPESGRCEAFFRCWTRKEAVIKAIGDGLSLPLDSFCVSLRADAPACILRAPGGHEGKWSLSDISPVAGYSAALVVEGPSPELRLWAVMSADTLLNQLGTGESATPRGL